MPEQDADEPLHFVFGLNMFILHIIKLCAPVMHMTISFTLDFMPQLLLQPIITPVIGTLNMYLCKCQLYEVLDTIFLLDEC